MNNSSFDTSAYNGIGSEEGEVIINNNNGSAEGENK